MSGKVKKKERAAEAAAIVANDPKALLNAQLAIVRMDGAIEGCETALKTFDTALGQVREALGATKANRRALFAEVDRLQKAAKVDGKTATPPADGETKPEAPAPE